jgi:hypothetical protein
MICAQPNTFGLFCACSTLTYAERLAKLNAESLELRRLKADLIMHYKISHNLVCISGDVMTFHKACLVTRGHNMRFDKPYSRINCRSHSFACRSINAWNSLPAHIVNSNNIPMFKSLLKSVDLSKFMHF